MVNVFKASLISSGSKIKAALIVPILVKI